MLNNNYIDNQNIIDQYKLKIDSLPKEIKETIKNVSILGSFGTGYGKGTSDMDIQIITNSKTISLDLLTAISDIELNYRVELSRDLNLPNLARHRSSIFTMDEWEKYVRGFLISFLYPRIYGEYKHITGEVVTGENLQPQSSKVFNADLIVSLMHKNHGYRDTGEAKRIRRNVRDIYRVSKGIRVKGDNEIDSLFEQEYGSSFEKVLEHTANLLESILKSDGDIYIKSKKTSDSLLWTLEKTRWEFIECYKNSNYYNHWRLGITDGFGFNPLQIQELINRVEFLRKNNNYSGISKEMLKVLQLIINKENKPDNIIKDLYGLINQRVPSMLSQLDLVKQDRL